MPPVGVSDLGPTDLVVAIRASDGAKAATGISLLRIYPQSDGTAAVVTRFRTALQTGAAPLRLGDENGYWHGTAGMQLVEPFQASAER